mmetsp:Transcript_23414/g.34565  ORF Transcript_23414/g.34565 Transcript_23414/m.34565 type:complete len:90 (+) Transcript_23414:424-693(+)
MGIKESQVKENEESLGFLLSLMDKVGLSGQKFVLLVNKFDSFLSRVLWILTRPSLTLTDRSTPQLLDLLKKCCSRLEHYITFSSRALLR